MQEGEVLPKRVRNFYIHFTIASHSLSMNLNIFIDTLLLNMPITVNLEIMLLVLILKMPEHFAKIKAKIFFK